tara:strand:- start:719 stop:1381 length:663 start_codon:yes stop_codon:yes gene_type:complete
MKNKKVVVFGSTGLIGSYLINYLLSDPTFKQIILVTRRPLRINNKKLINQIINFSSKEEIDDSIQNCSIVFSAIGTTKAKVQNNKKKYREIDFDINLNIAKYCKIKNVNKFILVSSSGANAKSSNFYLKLKGEIEHEINKLNLNSFIVFRPSLLLGNRNEFRLGERIGQVVLPFFSKILPPNFKPVHAKLVAKAMILYSKSNILGNNIISNKKILKAILN